VTGGAGYVGSRLVPVLLDAGWSVRVLDLEMYGDAGPRAWAADSRWPSWRPRLERLNGDIRDPKVVADAVDSVDAVIHLAGISHDPTDGFDEVLARQCNFDAVGLILAHARRAGVRRFLHASTSSVYGIQSADDIVEELEPDPIGPYARYKSLSEWLVTAAAGADFCAVNLRSATVCGWSPRQRFDLTVNKLTIDALTKGVITVHGGEQRRPNVHIDDLVSCYRVLLEADATTVSGKTYNLAQINLTVGDIARLIQRELSGLDVRIDIAPIHDKRDYHLCADRLERELGFRAMRPIGEAVRTLRRHALEEGSYPDPEDPLYYNLRSMCLERRDSAYQLLNGVR
jgi:nucleoside-diphosphate-sugar epimerase